MYCPYCGARVDEVDAYCRACGRRLHSLRQAMRQDEEVERRSSMDMGETCAIPASAPADPGVTQAIGNGYDPDKTHVLGDAAAEEEYAAMEAVLAKGRRASYDRDFTGLEVIAGEETGYIPQRNLDATSQMPVVSDEMFTSRASGDKAHVVASAPEGKRSGKKKGKAGLVVGIVLALFLVAGVVGGYLWYSNEQDLKAKARSLHAVPLTIVAEGFNNDATGIPVMVEGVDFEGTVVSGMYYVNAAGEGIELMRGTYTLTIAASPIGSDGTLWTVPAEPRVVMIPDTIEPYAACDDAKGTPVELGRINPLDVTVASINLSYEYAKYDPSHGAYASGYRDAAIAAHEAAVFEAEAAAEAARIAAEEEAMRIAEEKAKSAASPDGFYAFAYAPTNVRTDQDDFDYWHIDAKKDGVIKKAESLEGLSKSTDHVTSLVFRLPAEGVTYETSGGTAGIKPLDEDAGYETFTKWLSANNAQGLQIIVHIVDGSVVYARFCS